MGDRRLTTNKITNAINIFRTFPNISEPRLSVAFRDKETVHAVETTLLTCSEECHSRFISVEGNGLRIFFVRWGQKRHYVY